MVCFTLVTFQYASSTGPVKGTNPWQLQNKIYPSDLSEFLCPPQEQENVYDPYGHVDVLIPCMVTPAAILQSLTLDIITPSPNVTACNTCHDIENELYALIQYEQR